MKKTHITFIDRNYGLLLPAVLLAGGLFFSCQRREITRQETRSLEEVSRKNLAETKILQLNAETLNNYAALLLALGEYRKNHGSYPEDLKKLELSEELSRIMDGGAGVFKINIPGHPETEEVRHISSLEYEDDIAKAIEDTGKWLYFNNPASKHYGKLLIDCDHQTTNSEGKAMKFYQLAE